MRRRVSESLTSNIVSLWWPTGQVYSLAQHRERVDVHPRVAGRRVLGAEYLHRNSVTERWIQIGLAEDHLPELGRGSVEVDRFYYHTIHGNRRLAPVWPFGSNPCDVAPR